MTSTLKFLYSFASPKKRGKERFETILEPLQAVLQIGFISFYPVGTKIAIKHNMLVIQPPNYSQPVSRWYNNDTQDDLCYLFNVFSRFTRYYSFMATEYPALHRLLVSNAQAGIDKLIRTYSDTNRPHILHTLSMYKRMLNTPQSLAHAHIQDMNDAADLQHLQNQQPQEQPQHANSNPTALSSILPKKKNQTQSQSQPQLQSQIAMQDIITSDATATNSVDTNTANIDAVFGRIVEKYNSQAYTIIYNVLLQLHRNNDDSGGDYIHYINGLNQVLQPINTSIKKWIDENIVF
jgi:hypothetical protein